MKRKLFIANLCALVLTWQLVATFGPHIVLNIWLGYCSTVLIMIAFDIVIPD